MVIGVLGIHCDKKCADKVTRDVDRDFKTSPKMDSATRNLARKEGRAARIEEKREGDWRSVQEASSAVRIEPVVRNKTRSAYTRRAGKMRTVDYNLIVYRVSQLVNGNSEIRSWQRGWPIGYFMMLSLH